MMLKRIRELLSRRGDKPPTVAPTNDEARAPGPVAVHRGPRVVHRPIPRCDLDPDAVKIVQRLTRFDHSAYLVGGCVRDLLLERRPKDFDVGTSATPPQVRRLFRNSRIIGRRFRLAHIYFHRGKIIEVATFRSRNGSEGDAAEDDDGDLMIRDDNRFGTAEEDALRRDFTINSLFYDINNETVLDHADGLGDLRRKLVRTIGDPLVRFREDPIRILRAIKFAARLDFTIEQQTLEALRATRAEIPKAAPPRVLEEINRFCRGGAARQSFELLRETGVFQIILPELAEAYGGEASSWDLLFALLVGIDRRLADGNEADTSEILTCLLLPAIRQQLGWSAEGRASQPRNLDIRGIVDALVRPIALRLRFPRKDQESCRLTVLTLFRMVPSRRMRRNSKRAILRRECLPDALWMLEILADQLGGDFEEARDYWQRSVAGGEPPRTTAAPRGGTARGRSRRRRTAAGPAATSQSSADRAPRADPMDDDSFFSKLPSVPEIGRVDGRGDRYGAAALSARAEADSHAAVEPAEDERRDRGARRRSRRGPKRRKDPTGTGGSTAEQSATQTENQRPATKSRRRRRARRRRSTSGDGAQRREGEKG